MEPASDYYTAWAIYWLAVIVAQLLFWRALAAINSQQVKVLSQLLLFALLITPVSLETGQPHWVPAFMAAIMEGLNDGFDAALSRLWPILLMMLVFILLAAAWRRYGLRR